jgi:hypothetical protein
MKSELKKYSLESHGPSNSFPNVSFRTFLFCMRSYNSIPEIYVWQSAGGAPYVNQDRGDCVGASGLEAHKVLPCGPSGTDRPRKSHCVIFLRILEFTP